MYLAVLASSLTLWSTLPDLDRESARAVVQEALSKPEPKGIRWEVGWPNLIGNNYLVPVQAAYLGIPVYGASHSVVVDRKTGLIPRLRNVKFGLFERLLAPKMRHTDLEEVFLRLAIRWPWFEIQRPVLIWHPTIAATGLDLTYREEGYPYGPELGPMKLYYFIGLADRSLSTPSVGWLRYQSLVVDPQSRAIIRNEAVSIEKPLTGNPQVSRFFPLVHHSFGWNEIKGRVMCFGYRRTIASSEGRVRTVPAPRALPEGERVVLRYGERGCVCRYDAGQNLLWLDNPAAPVFGQPDPNLAEALRKVVRP